MNIEIPQVLKDEIARGNAVLFLGAGATIGAKNGTSNAPLGDELSHLISDKFLGGKFKDKPLDWIAELAKSETSLFQLQNFINTIFEPLEPASFHSLISEFKWKGIATTNYDYVVEKVYARNQKSVQNIIPFISDNDRIAEKIKLDNDLIYIKLHGCITRINDPLLPLVLSHDQYAFADVNRTRLFATVNEWAHEHPIVFIGHELYDSDIRLMIESLNTLGDFRPRYYLVKPNITEIESRLWESRRITTISATFKGFLNALDFEFPKNKRALFKVVHKTEHPIQLRFKNHESLSPSLNEFLTTDVEYVYEGMQIPQGEPKAFYKGYSLDWFPIEQELDVKRRLSENILFDVVLNDENQRATLVDFYVIKAEAGAGKSILLKRIAWDASSQANALCLFVKDQAYVNYDYLFEIYRLCEERIFLFVDNASENIENISRILSKAKADKIKLTIISSERVNLWNIYCNDKLDKYLTESFTLRYLSKAEIEELLELLKKHKSLGRLHKLSSHQQVEEFEKVAGRQLLVALHEATLGKPFEEIILDEYNRIQPNIAKLLYLSICVLNRMDIPVRAGFIARVHKIPFAKFKEKLFAPLEHVVKVSQDKIIGDYMYSARHPEIAEMVFEQILATSEDKYAEYMNLLNELNTSYSSDDKSFLGLIRANSILDFFPDYQMGRDIYELAEKISPFDKRVFHQRAIYEMKRVEPSLKLSLEYLEKAQKIDEKDPTIIHSLAELYYIKSELSSNSIEKKKFREQCEAYSLLLKNEYSNANYARVTLIKMHMSYLQELLDSDDKNSIEIDNEIKSIESYLEEGLQENPGDPYLRVAETELNEKLNKYDKALESLEYAFSKNNRDSYIAIRLSKAYLEKKQFSKAKEVLKIALEANKNDKKINFNYALILRELDEENINTLIYHFRRGFTKWDNNYEAQFWYARYSFESKDEDHNKEAEETFAKLRSAWIPYKTRNRIRDYYKEDGKPKKFVGSLRSVQQGFAFLKVEDLKTEIFVHKNDAENIWSSLRPNQRVKFEIGFTMRGANAVNLELYK